MIKIPNEIRNVLDGTGLPWRLEHGGKHIHIFVNGRRIAVFSRGSLRLAGCGLANLIASIKRAVRAMEAAN
ncbi:MAG TPA: hypothetical protein VE986_06290 [Hyphomicrobiales bacterium]|nr:hypothetical protein [Hyphomicrobiales bacterium]